METVMYKERWGLGALLVSHAMFAVLMGSLGCARILGGKPPDPPRNWKLDLPAEVLTSSNGFRITALPDSSANLVRVETRVTVGAGGDPPGKEGLAHLVEHMMGETKIPIANGDMSTVRTERARFALSSNAFTGMDYTHYVAVTLPSRMDEVIRLHLKMLRVGCKTWDQATFDREREVVRNELRERNATVSGRLMHKLTDAVYEPGNPYKHSILGTQDSLSRITISDGCKFIKDHYVPRNIIITVAGKGAMASAIGQAGSKWMGMFKDTPPAPRNSVTAPRTTGSKVLEVEAGVDRPRLFTWWPIPPEGTVERRMLWFALGKIEDAVSSRAFEYGWGRNVSESIIGGAKAPVLVLSVELNSMSDIGDARAAIRDAVRSLGGSTVPRIADKETNWWKMTREYRRESLMAGIESLADRAWAFSDYRQFDTSPTFVIGRLKELEKVGPQAIRKIIEGAISTDRMGWLLVKPNASGDDLATGVFGNARYTNHPPTSGVVVDPQEADRDLPLPSDLRAATHVERFTLDNGLDVLMWDGAGIPLVRGQLVIKSGSGQDPKGLAGMAGVAGEWVGADMTVFSGRDTQALVDNLVERLAYELRGWKRERYDKWRKLVSSELKRPHRAERSAYRHELARKVFGDDHPYARGGLTPKSVKRMSVDAVRDFRTAHHVPKNSALLLVGKFDMELIRKHVDYRFGFIDSGASARPLVATAQERTGPAFVKGRGEPGGDTVQLDIRFAAPGGIDHRHAARLVLAQVLNYELLDLRTRYAVTYGFNAYFAPRRAAGLWSIAGAADRSRAAEAARLVQNLLADMHADKEFYRLSFVLARRKVAERLMAESHEPTDILRKLRQMVLFDLDGSHYETLIRDVAKLRLSDIDKVLRSELAAKQQVFGVRGGSVAVDDAMFAAHKWIGKPSPKTQDVATSTAKPAETHAPASF